MPTGHGFTDYSDDRRNLNAHDIFERNLMNHNNGPPGTSQYANYDTLSGFALSGTPIYNALNLFSEDAVELEHEFMDECFSHASPM